MKGAMSYGPHAVPEATLIRIVQSYYDAVDSRDADRLGSLYLPTPFTTLQFNADSPIVTVEAIKSFSTKLFQAVAGIKHSMVEIWTNPLKGGVVPVDLPPPRSNSTVTVASTALPTFSVRNASGVTSLALPATSIFTIDNQTEKFVSVTICLTSPRCMLPSSHEPERLALAAPDWKAEQARGPGPPITPRSRDNTHERTRSSGSRYARPVCLGPTAASFRLVS